MPHDPPPVVAVYREMLLNYNEPFIRAQAEGLLRYRACYVGARRVAGGLDVPVDPALVVRERYRSVDGLIDPIASRVPRRGFGALGRRVRDGSLIGRAAEAAFKLLGIIPPAMLAALHARRPALLHAYTGVSGAQALPLARQLAVPLVVSCTGYEATATDAELRRWRFRGRVLLRRRAALWREAALFIAVSDFVRRRLIEQGWPAAKIVVHHIGVDTETFRPDPTVAREPVVLYVGRLIETKGVIHLIDAMRAASASAPGAELVVIGDGPLRTALERQARDAGIKARFCGVQSAADVRNWMNRARTLCIPSVTATDGTVEALPAVAFEAMAMALPVTGFASGGIPEGVLHGVTGLLAAERDVAALAAYLTSVLADEGLWRRLSIASRARACEHFDLRRQNAALEALYDRVRDQRGAATS